MASCNISALGFVSSVFQQCANASHLSLIAKRSNSNTVERRLLVGRRIQNQSLEPLLYDLPLQGFGTVRAIERRDLKHFDRWQFC